MRRLSNIIYAADLFCGAGGTSTGLALAAEEMGLNLNLTAINHWERAIETHSSNHPWANHLCTDLDGLKPSKLIPGGKLDLLVASPECTHHSVARGGKPMDDQSRASAWHVLHWCQELYVKNVLIENVPEFEKWGPLGVNRKPLKSKVGHTYQAFVNALRSLGYRVNQRIINCANYGDATTRRRFFLIAQRGNKRPSWPEFTHGQDTTPDIFGHCLKPWKPAREIIDWNNPGHSIFLSPEDVKTSGLKIKRPLAQNTLRRIVIGIERYWGEWAKPFLVMLYGTNDARSIDMPMPTVTANGLHVGLAQPLLFRYNDGGRLESIDKPFSTFDTSNRIGVCRPFVTIYKGKSKVRSVDNGLPTLTSKQNLYLCQPLILNQDQRGKVRTVNESLPTITTSGAHALIQPFMVSSAHKGASHITDLNKPTPTLLAKGEKCVVRPFIVKYYGTGRVSSIDAPIDTVTTDDRFGLVRPQFFEIDGERYLLDILFRMLTPKELAAAHSFPSDYKFVGTKSDVVRQIGNSVPVETSKALCKSRLAA